MVLRESELREELRLTMLSVGKQLPSDLTPGFLPQLLVHRHLRRMHDLVLPSYKGQKRRLRRNRRDGKLRVPLLGQEEGDMEERAGEGHHEGDQGFQGERSVFDDDRIDLSSE